MLTKVQKWVNSLALRIPKAFQSAKKHLPEQHLENRCQKT